MKGILLISLVLIFLPVKAQEKDTIYVKPYVLISNNSLKTNPGSVQFSLPLSNTSSLAEAMMKYSALFVKYYGPSSLATVSMRGMGAQHTAVMWNGINLQSTMNGVIDFNLLPSFFIDKAIIETGANSGLNGNGTIAGAVHILNETKRERSLVGEFQLGSFDNQSCGLAYNSFRKKFTFAGKVFIKKAENDFKYIDYFQISKPVVRIQNSKVFQIGAMQEITYESNGHRFYLNAWILRTERQLSPPMGAISMDEKQDDFSGRFLLMHQFKIKRIKVNNKIAYLDETINYYNKLLSPALNRSGTYFMESEFNYSISENNNIGAVINHSYQHAITDGFRQGVIRNISSGMLKFNHSSYNKKLKTILLNRFTVYDGILAPSSPEVGFAYSFNPQMKLKGNAGISLRIPSFNDMYWNPGGNLNLKPETGRKSELAFEYDHKVFKSGISAFYHRLNNWILWQPDPLTNIWRASNAREVTSRGVECSFEFNRDIFKNQHIQIIGRAQYVNSTNTKVYSDNLESLNKQVFYTPVYTGFTQLAYNIRKYIFTGAVNYNGERFTTPDNNEDYILPAYTIFTASVGREFRTKNGQSGIINFTVNNLSGNNYQVVENRPMPGRNYNLTIKINIKYE